MRHDVARGNLKEAVKKRTVSALEVAIDGGKQVGLPSSDLDEAKVTLSREEKKIECVASLKDAIRSRVPKDCRDAISNAEKVVPNCRELNDCKKVLKEEDRRDEARAGLLEAIDNRKIDKLTRWIGKAEGAGMQYLGSEELVKAKVVLAEEERKVCARKALEAAERSRSIPELRAAAKEAENAQLEAHEFERANRTLAEELPKAARSGLETALAGRGVKELKMAIKEGETVGLDASELNLPRLALGEEQLSEALRRKASFEIRRAIEDGERFGVDAIALEHARQALAVEVKKDMARQQLRDSEASRRVDELMIALSCGRAAGLQEWEMDFASRVIEEERLKLMSMPARIMRAR